MSGDPDVPALVTVPILLSVLAASRVLGCSPMTVRRRISAGELPGVLEHDRLMIRADDLLAYIERLERYGPARPQRRRGRQRRHDFGFLDD